MHKQAYLFGISFFFFEKGAGCSRCTDVPVHYRGVGPDEVKFPSNSNDSIKKNSGSPINRS